MVPDVCQMAQSIMKTAEVSEESWKIYGNRIRMGEEKHQNYLQLCEFMRKNGNWIRVFPCRNCSLRIVGDFHVNSFYDPHEFAYFSSPKISFPHENSLFASKQENSAVTTRIFTRTSFTLCLKKQKTLCTVKSA
jgi:hypothetical protein